MLQRQAEERTPCLVEGNLGTLRVRTVEIVHAETPENRQQRFIVAAVKPDGVVGGGVRAVDLRREILQVVLVGKVGEVRVQPPVRIVLEVKYLAVLELDLEAVLSDPEARDSGPGFPRVQVVQVVKAQAGDLLTVFLTGVHQVEADRHAAARAQVEAPPGKQPRVLVLAGVRVTLAAEHDAVGVEQERPPV